jgi:hypothetical protein
VGLANLGSESETCVGSRVRLVGVSISFEKNFYRLPFTPPSLVLRIGPQSRASLGVPEESSSEFRYCSCILSLFRLKYNSNYLSILLFESITFSFYFAVEVYSRFRLKLA